MKKYITILTINIYGIAIKVSLSCVPNYTHQRRKDRSGPESWSRKDTKIAKRINLLYFIAQLTGEGTHILE